MLEIAFVTTLQPETHYSRYLLNELVKVNPNLEIWADRDKKNKNLPYKYLNLCWSKGPFYPFQLFWQALKSSAKIIHVQHEINMFGGKLSALIFPLLLFVLKVLGKKIVITVHAVVPQEEINQDFLAAFKFPRGYIFCLSVKFFFFFLFKSILFFADRIIVHSNYLKDVLVKDYSGQKSKINVIPIGVPAPKSNKYTLNAPWAKKLKNKKIILYFGYLLRRKGLEYLLEAFERFSRKHKTYSLVLAGGELDYQKDYARELENKVRRKKLDKKIIFTGFISQEEILALYDKAQFLTLPYTYSISSSLPLSFAMQYQKPVIATNIGSLKEEVVDKKDGILVPPCDNNALFRAIETLATNTRLYEKLSRGQKEKCLERSWKNVAQKTYLLYSRVYK